MPTSIERRISESDVGGKSGEWIDFKSRALLLVKAPGASYNNTQRIDQLAQLLDVHRLILAIISAPAQGDFEKVVTETMARSQVIINNGSRQKDDPDGNRVIFGRSFPRGFMSRYSLDDTGVWAIKEKMAVQW